jgi:DNA-directed RNA polymerase subunit K/omega
MSEVEIPHGEQSDVEEAPRPKAAPIESRFLFVDVSALRAKQLRRGAKPRLPERAPDDATPRSAKAERVAMDEVHQGLVDWNLPEFKAVFDIR